MREPDLWDLKTWGYSDASNARYSEEGYQEPYVAFAKPLTSKPVVGVGRFTSPDTMVSQIKRGVLDLIGAARPSIADPFLPKKIEEGREEEIREVYRLQHLLFVLSRGGADSLHAKPHHGGGMASRLAP